MKSKQKKFHSSSSSKSSSSSLLSKKKIKKPIVTQQVQKEQICFIPSGILARFQNDKNGVTLKFNQPIDACLPPKNQIYRLFVFKDKDDLGTIDLNEKSTYLIGREEIADIHLDNPSVSKQHAVIQFRKTVNNKQPKAYLIDLETTNGTFINGNKIEAACYIELLANDILRFGTSTRDFVFMISQNNLL